MLTGVLRFLKSLVIRSAVWPDEGWAPYVTTWTDTGRGMLSLLQTAVEETGSRKSRVSLHILCQTPSSHFESFQCFSATLVSCLVSLPLEEKDVVFHGVEGNNKAPVKTFFSCKTIFKVNKKIGWRGQKKGKKKRKEGKKNPTNIQIGQSEATHAAM